MSRILLVAGSRSFAPKYDKKWNLVSGWPHSKMVNVFDQASYALDMTFSNVIHGGAQGVDMMAGEWARSKGYPVDVFLPDWDQFGKAAGYMRNRDMVEVATAAIVVWDGRSKGTRHTLDLLDHHLTPYVLVRREP